MWLKVMCHPLLDDSFTDWSSKETGGGQERDGKREGKKEVREENNFDIKMLWIYLLTSGIEHFGNLI
jgi:hypothetical protein